MIDGREMCMCSKSDDIDHIKETVNALAIGAEGRNKYIEHLQRDMDSIKKSNGEIREKLFDGISTSIPEIKTDVKKIFSRLGKLEKRFPEASAESNKRPKIPRIVGTIVIVVAFCAVSFFFLFLMLKTGIVSLEDIGKMISAIVN